MAVSVRCGDSFTPVDKFEFTAKVVSVVAPVRATLTAGSNSLSYAERHSIIYSTCVD